MKRPHVDRAPRKNARRKSVTGPGGRLSLQAQERAIELAHLHGQALVTNVPSMTAPAQHAYWATIKELAVTQMDSVAW